MLWRRASGWPTTSSPEWAWGSPFEELERMRRQMDVLTDAFSTGFLGAPFAGVFPLVNVTEDKDNYYVRAELPRIKTDELDISVTGETLSITGERRLPVEEEKGDREQGLYLHPVEHGLSGSMGIDFEQMKMMDEEQRALKEKYREAEKAHPDHVEGQNGKQRE